MLTGFVVVAAVAVTGCAAGQTGAPSLVEHDTAILEGAVVSDAGGSVEYWAQYGTTKAYGSETPHQTVVTQQNTPTPVGFLIEGLQRSTTYHYRVCAQDGSQRGGPGCGQDRTFKTQSVACGETVTTDVRLTADFFCFNSPVEDPGLVVGAPGITIDLNGFEMRGPIFIGSGSAAAIDNSGGFDGVTIKDGQVGNFGDGIHLEDASGNRILHVQSFGSPDGIEIRGGSANEIRHSNIHGRSNGVLASNTTDLVVADGTAAAAFGGGMVLNGLVGSRIVRNEVPGVGNCCGNRGISVAGNGNVIMGNLVEGWNGGNIVLAGGADNKLLENEVRGGFLPSNETFDAEGDGLFVNAFTAGTIVRGNHAHDNEGDGIEVQGVQTRITDNTADANGDFGIDAVAGVTDGGGNTASGNGNPLECRNVFCL